MITVKLRPPLTGLIGAKELTVKLRQGTLREVLEAAGGDHPKLRAAVCEEDGSFSQDFKFILNNESINLKDNLETLVSERDELILLMPIAGG
ncbi:MAG: MoaD/ThiS family protein [Candidatus Tectomicrobia bacterium]|nr:MoaD/ThiS family protein [Candidatus Tectomicrobia bacterium]